MLEIAILYRIEREFKSYLIFCSTTKIEGGTGDFLVFIEPPSMLAFWPYWRDLSRLCHLPVNVDDVVVRLLQKVPEVLRPSRQDTAVSRHLLIVHLGERRRQMSGGGMTCIATSACTRSRVTDLYCDISVHPVTTDLYCDISVHAVGEHLQQVGRQVVDALFVARLGRFCADRQSCPGSARAGRDSGERRGTNRH